MTEPTPEALDGYVDRRWSIPESLWDQLLETASSTGVNYAELVCMCLESGLAVQLGKEVERARPKPPPVPWTTVTVELGETVLGRLDMRQVPSPDEILTVDGNHYVVLQRAWTVTKGNVTAYIRVEAFPPAKL